MKRINLGQKHDAIEKLFCWKAEENTMWQVHYCMSFTLLTLPRNYHCVLDMWIIKKEPSCLGELTTMGNWCQIDLKRHTYKAAVKHL